jgi:hypothetical protein
MLHIPYPRIRRPLDISYEAVLHLWPSRTRKHLTISSKINSPLATSTPKGFDDFQQSCFTFSHLDPERL